MRILPVLLGALVSAQAASARAATEQGDAPAQPPSGVLTRAPELVEFVPAEYPEDAEAAGIEGAVVLSIVIDEHGEVLQAVVLEPGAHPSFAAAALHAVQRFRFRPAEIDGAPAPVEITYRYEFVLRRPEPKAAAADAPVVLSGRVVERGTRVPVADASVSAGDVVVETDGEGRFAIRGSPPGEVTVRVVSPEHEPLSATERIEAGKRVDVEYRLSRRSYDPYEAVVRAERPREVSVHTLAVEEVRTIPGTQGDTLKVVQNLPGVARSPFGIGLLVVRGSEPSETNVYLDGVQVPLLYHFGGITSVVSSDVVDGIDFYPGNFGSRFGRALGGSVDVRTREPRDRWHGAVQVDVFDGRALVEGPVGNGSGYLSLRRSWVDAVLAVALPRVAPDAADELRVAPRYWDYQGKLSFPLLGGTLSLLAFGSDDKLEFLDDDERSGRPTFFLSTLYHRAGARYRRSFGAATNDVVLALGRDSFDVLQSSNFGILTEIRSLTLREALSWRVSNLLTLEAGVDAVLRTFEYSLYAPPLPPEGSVDDVPERPEATLGETARGSWLAPAGYLEAELRPRRGLRLLAGLRADADSRLTGRKVTFDPRFSAFLDVAEGTTVNAAAGLFSSAPQPGDVTQTFGNPDLGFQRALHLSLGVRHALPLATRLELTGFYKRLRELIVPTRATDGAGRLEQLSNGGRGEVVGLELLLRRELARGVYGWLAYTFSRSLRQDDPTLPSYPAWHPFAFDQPHIFTLVLSYRLPGEWILGTRIRGVSGNPYTPAEGAVYDADTGRYQCIPGPARLSGRLPGFFQADARLDKRFVFEDWMFSLYLDVSNVTNRENAEFRFTSYDCSSSVPIPSVPVFPALGLRAEW